MLSILHFDGGEKMDKLFKTLIQNKYKVLQSLLDLKMMLYFYLMVEWESL